MHACAHAYAVAHTGDSKRRILMHRILARPGQTSPGWIFGRSRSPARRPPPARPHFLVGRRPRRFRRIPTARALDRGTTASGPHASICSAPLGKTLQPRARTCTFDAWRCSATVTGRRNARRAGIRRIRGPAPDPARVAGPAPVYFIHCPPEPPGSIRATDIARATASPATLAPQLQPPSTTATTQPTKDCPR
jgi:hypothetical protein